jgi:hypothetical protein
MGSPGAEEVIMTSKSNKDKKLNQYRADLKALEMAFPVVMLVRDTFKGKDPSTHKYCYQAAHGGSGALRRLGYQTKVFACGIVGWGSEWSGSVGLTGEECHALLISKCTKVAPLDEFLANFCEPLTLNGPPVHMAFEAFHNGDRAFVDLSIGQLAHLGYKSCPKATIYHGPGWPVCESASGSKIIYGPCPHSNEIDPKWFIGDNVSGLVDDTLQAMELAKSCKLDRDRFAEAVRVQFCD